MVAFCNFSRLFFLLSKQFDIVCLIRYKLQTQYDSPPVFLFRRHRLDL
jgi:hypothetical protein